MARNDSPAYGWKSLGIALMLGLFPFFVLSKESEQTFGAFLGALMLGGVLWPFTYVGLRVYMWFQMEDCPSCGKQVAKDRVMCPNCGGRGNRR